MNILTPVIEEQVQSGIIASIGQLEYHQASRQIAEILAELHRFVAETLRPVGEIKWFYKDPEYPLSILRNLFKEPSPYPRTSVGNNLSDLARRVPDLIYGLVGELVDSGDENSYWIAYRACRNLVKLDPVKVMNLLRVDEYRYNMHFD